MSRLNPQLIIGTLYLFIDVYRLSYVAGCQFGYLQYGPAKIQRHVIPIMRRTVSVFCGCSIQRFVEILQQKRKASCACIKI